MILVKYNIEAPVKLFQNAVEAGVLRWVVTGSFAEYGLAAYRYALIPPDAPLQPTDPYAASKAAGAVLFPAQALRAGAHLSYLRLFSI